MTTADDDLNKLRADRSVVPRPTGDIDLRMGDGSWLTVQRPTFGEIKRIIRAQRRLQDELEAGSNEARALQGDVEDKLTELGLKDGKALRPAHLENVNQIQKDARAVADRLEDITTSALAVWWADMFETLLPADKVPGEDLWPAYFTNPTIPTAMIEHWKAVPAGPG